MTPPVPQVRSSAEVTAQLRKRLLARRQLLHDELQELELSLAILDDRVIITCPFTYAGPREVQQTRWFVAAWPAPSTEAS